MFRRFIYTLVIVSLIVSSVAPASAAMRPMTADRRPTAADDATFRWSDYITPPDTTIQLSNYPTSEQSEYDIPAVQQQSPGPYRTTVTIRGTADLARLKKMGVTILASTKTTATVLADRAQLEQLAKLQFQPRATELVSRLQTATRTPLGATATAAQILAATAIDSDGDGLNDTEEGWWCTDPNNADSDNDKVKDGDEVNALRDWIAHTRATRPASGKPFAGWPPNHTSCYDSDYDSVPDAVEVYVFGLNPNRESTARDKFDDGQKLFGLTNCPGSGGGCGYGALPRQVDWGVIFAEMPTWVKPPYDHPFVAAFPIPEVSVVAGSWKVERVTTITTSQGQMTQTTNTYATSVTRGESSSIANTVTWNNWEEVSQAVSVPLGQQSSPRVAKPNVGVVGLLWTAAKVFGPKVALKMAGNQVAKFLVQKGIGEAAKQIAIGAAGSVLGDIISDRLLGHENKDQLPSPNKIENLEINNITVDVEPSLTLNQNFDFQGMVNSMNGVQYAINQQGALLARGLHDIAYAIQQPRYTETHTSGRSWGGAQTTTHTVMEEHTISQGQAFAAGEQWSTAWAVDSSYAANLTFNYTIKNAGSEYARQITGLIFNIYLGDDPNPIISYPAWQQFPNGKLENLFPGDTKTFASTPAVHLTLDQMRRIDLGEKLIVTLADFSYGDDQLFYQDAINSGVTIYVDDGVADNDELVDQYVLPTWGNETVQDVIARYFRIGMDDEGLMNAIWTPEFSNPPQWNEYFLSEIAWWNVYLTQADAGNTQLRDLTAQAGSALLFRFNRDSDRDGYPDRIEMQYGTNRNDPASHPNPEVLAGYTVSRVGNTVTVKLALQNNGTFDAFGVQAVMYSPDGTTTINDNTIGGNGRVRPGAHVAVGSLVKQPVKTNWTSSTAKPYSTGDYTGSTDKTYTFTVATPGVVGSGTTAMNWNDGAGNSGTLALGSSYRAPLPIAVGNEGLQIGFDTGTIISGESFTVAAYTPRDTFKFTVNNDPYTMPVIVVSYSDMQGSHRFITTRQMNTLGEDLTPYSSQMLRNLSVDIVTQAKFVSSGNNTTHIVINNPHSQAIQNANLYVDIIGGGAVVAHLPYTLTLQSGPTIVPVTWSTASFSPAYNSTIDYLMLASWTDSEGNVIDTRARPLSTFDVDPVPSLNTSPASWNFGTVTQGAQPQQTISIVNTGIMPLNVVVTSSDPKLTLSDASGIISVPPAGTRPIVASLDTTTFSGAVSMSITIRSNDPAHQTVTVPVNGNVTTATGSAAAFDIANRPLDKTVRVYGNIPQFSTVDFTHNIVPDTATIEPCKIYAADGTTLKGVGKYCADFGGATTSAQMFGDGRDGIMPSNGNLDNNNGVGVGTLNGVQGSTSVSVVDRYAVWRINPGDVVLIHQTRGNGAGNWELNRAVSDFTGSGTFTLEKPLNFSYVTNGGNEVAQIQRVPQYTDCPITGTVTPLGEWNGTWGGIFAIHCSGTINLTGQINISGASGGSGKVDPVLGGSGIGFGGGRADIANNDCLGRGVPGDGTLPTPEGNGGEGSDWTNCGGGDGAGGGNGTSGQNGSYGRELGRGGKSVGNESLTIMNLGGGGAGSGGEKNTHNVGGGGAGGGIAIILGKSINIVGSINANGGNGGGYDRGAGGGAGGSILLRGQTISLGNGLVAANGGFGGPGIGGGDGGIGRIRVEYCNTLSGSTNPAASTQKLTCYIAEKTNDTTVHYTVPDAITAPGQNYVMQFARRLAFSGAGNQLTYTRVVSQTYTNATMDVLVTNVGAGGATNLRLEVGGSTVYSATQTITQPTTISIPNFASAINQYLITQSPNSTIDIPMRVTIDRQADVLLTNFGLTPGAGVDLVVNPSDLVLGCPGGASCLASEGNTIPITVTVRNTGAQPASSAVVGYYACRGDACIAPTNGVPTNAQLLGNSYVATIPAGGSATANFNWNTEGFTRTQTLYAFVDPPNAIPETLENNNIVSQTLYIKTKPDLRVASIALSSTDRVVGEPITATIVISNTGETLASTNITRINEWGERGDSSSQDLATGTITPTSTLTLTTQLTPILFGARTITVTADATNVITESLESNNILTRTVFIGLPVQAIDAGAASDLAYDTTRGFGWLNGATYDFGGTITKTVRYDGAGALQYRFDGLQPTRFYHFDATFYQEGESFTQKILFDGIDSGKTISLVNGQTTTASILVPPAAYADGTMIVTIQRQPGGTSAPSRLRAPNSIGPAFISQLTLTPVEYIYLDSGGASDVAYDVTRGYGYLNGFASGLGGSDAVNTYRTVFTNTVFYRFSNLNPTKNYNVNVTMYDGIASTRAQTVTIDGAVAVGCANLVVNSIVRATCPVTPTLYTSDRAITVGVVCGNCTGPRVNEIALEEKTRDVIEPPAPPTPTPTFTPTVTPTSVNQTTISAFAAQWSGSVVQVTWSTTKEYKIDQFQLYRSTTLNPGAWTVVKTQPSQSNCATSTTPYSYAYTDSNVVAGQTYYYKLAWTGDTCGAGIAGAYPTPAIARAGIDLFLPLIQRDNPPNAPQRVPLPTLTPTPNRTPLLRSAPTPAK